MSCEIVFVEKQKWPELNDVQILILDSHSYLWVFE